MVGVEIVSTSYLPDDQLIQKIRMKPVKFGSETSAAYHIYKHRTEPPSDYVKLANDTIRFEGGDVNVSWNQEGDSRIICFANQLGKAFVLEKDYRVLLMTFEAYYPSQV